MNQEQILQIQMMEQEVNQLNYQLELIDHNLTELEELKVSLNEIDKKETKSMMINLGKKIFIPVEITEKKLMVEVGNKYFVKKTVGETSKIANDQIGKLNISKSEILYKLEDLNREIENLMRKLEQSHEH